mmetsp:Transcript_70244/g.164495  ORF Transcript_70244/g.164495 Transcript_70244/m.164495 type:complete len:222 (-) Transcript_70244:244-909(-)
MSTPCRMPPAASRSLCWRRSKICITFVDPSAKTSWSRESSQLCSLLYRCASVSAKKVAGCPSSRSRRFVISLSLRVISSSSSSESDFVDSPAGTSPGAGPTSSFGNPCGQRRKSTASRVRAASTSFWRLTSTACSRRYSVALSRSTSPRLRYSFGATFGRAPRKEGKDSCVGSSFTASASSAAHMRDDTMSSTSHSTSSSSGVKACTRASVVLCVSLSVPS